MAAVPITINGIQTDENGSRNVTIVGMASLTGVGVGGGPIVTPPSDAHPEHPIYNPPGIWGPNDPRPSHPIVLPPVEPGGPPVQIWPKPGPLPHPEHPIVLPEPPEPSQPPETVTVLKAPPATGGWGAVSDYGWAYFPAQGEAGPK